MKIVCSQQYCSIRLYNEVIFKHTKIYVSSEVSFQNGYMGKLYVCSRKAVTQNIFGASLLKLTLELTAQPFGISSTLQTPDFEGLLDSRK